jgi:hypothetical protein
MVRSCHTIESGAYRVLGGKMERNTALGRPKCRLEDNIKIDIKEIF